MEESVARQFVPLLKKNFRMYVSNRSLGENSPNLVTLVLRQRFGHATKIKNVSKPKR
jgi:hypothetical protein